MGTETSVIIIGGGSIIGAGGSNHWRDGGGGHHPHTDLKEAMSELLPEEIPGLPRHRPGEFSPR